jgi:hypothetical protein
MFSVRWTEESDYTELCAWWKAFRFPAPQQMMLPDMGASGFMVSKDGVNICAGFLYYTNSAFALFEYVVSNFEYKSKDRTDALKLLYKTAEIQATREGCKLLFSTVKNPHLIKNMKEFGWTEGSATVEMIKGL